MKDGVTPKQAKHGDRLVEAMLSRYSSGERAQRAFSNPSFESSFFRLLDELGFNPTNLLEHFRFEVYGKCLGFDCPDLTCLAVPAIRAQFNWAFPIVAIDDKAPIEACFQQLKKQFAAKHDSDGGWKWTNRILDKIVDKNDRNPLKGPYVIRTRDRPGADEEFRNLSANNLAQRGVPGVTLYERLVMGTWYYVKTGEHLDAQDVTLCSGSRCDDGRVPIVYWHSCRRGLDVSWCGPDSRDVGLRCREVVS